MIMASSGTSQKAIEKIWRMAKETSGQALKSYNETSAKVKNPLKKI